MCGLAGLWNLDGKPADSRLLAAMARTLVHRGPDDEGRVFIRTDTGSVSSDSGARANLGLASRRLSILDLSPAGRMPMTDETGRLFIVFNGEIYNYRELRDDLAAKGHRFRTRTDTEVILAAYREWGFDAPRRFNGMWALALYDADQRHLFCSRDRLGVKPFYYHHAGGLFVFGSEIKALLAHPGVPRQPYGPALFNYLARSYRYVDGRPTTFFEGIRTLEPGCNLVVTANGLEEKRYWRLDPGTRVVYPRDDQYAERFLELLADAVRIRLRSDVPVAAQLSGGLDSSAVAALAARFLGSGPPLFSAAYDRKPFDEREFIHPTAEATGGRLHLVFPSPQDLAGTLPRMIRAFDEPVCTVTFYALWQIMAQVKHHGYKVILAGHGADELTAGYYDHFLHHFADLADSGANGHLAAEIEAWMNHHGRRRSEHWTAYQARRTRGIPYMEAGLAAYEPYEKALDPEFAKENQNPKPDEAPYNGVLLNRLYNELTFETLPAVLKAEDRVTMAHSIESRHPFLDYRLVEYCFAVPGAQKIRHGLGKYIQRQALRGVIPEMVRTRVEKVGFNAPSEDWFRSELMGLVEEKVRDGRLVREGLFQREPLARLWAEHKTGRANHYQFLWQLINLEIWIEEYFGHAPIS